VPIVLLVVSGRPRVLEGIERLPQVGAVLQAFLPGPTGGRAFAEVIYGLLEPSGRLALSWPTHSSSLFYPHWHAVSQQCDGDRHCGVDWAFGRGLSYSRVEYSGLHTSSSVLARGTDLTVSVTVTNRGPRPLNHSVLLFAAASYRRVVPAAQELVDFRRIELAASGSQRVNFRLSANALQYVGLEDEWLLEGGRYALWMDAELRPTSTDDCAAISDGTSARCVFVDVRGDCQGPSCVALAGEPPLRSADTNPRSVSVGAAMLAGLACWIFGWTFALCVVRLLPPSSLLRRRLLAPLEGSSATRRDTQELVLGHEVVRSDQPFSDSLHGPSHFRHAQLAPTETPSASAVHEHELHQTPHTTGRIA